MASLRRCIRPVRQCTRFLSGGGGETLVNLEEVHREWRGAGLPPARAPESVVSKFGAGFLERSLAHAGLDRFVQGAGRLRPVPVTFLEGGRAREVDYSTILTPTQAANPPKVDLSGLEEGPYTITITTPDSPDCTVHWCTSGPTTLRPYVAPTPLQGSGFYRYLVLVRRGEVGSLEEVDSLPVVGAAHFQCSWDSSVGITLARDLGLDERVFKVDRRKSQKEGAAEQLFLQREWEMKTEFM